MASPNVIGVIHDTNSNGRFDLVAYRDGILAVKGTYIGVAIRASGPGMVGLGGAATAGAGTAGSVSSGSSYEDRRLAKVLQRSREEILAADRKNHFIAVNDVSRALLRRRWYGHSLTILTRDCPGGRKYAWKPALNSFERVHGVLVECLGDRLLED